MDLMDREKESNLFQVTELYVNLRNHQSTKNYTKFIIELFVFTKMLQNLLSLTIKLPHRREKADINYLFIFIVAKLTWQKYKN